MKIKLLTPMMKDGKEIEAGSVIDIPESNAPKWIKRKWGEPVHKKEHKIKKETKEFKVDSKESK
tara:strand:- start:293 stop:484 length:192 start_codon:yes stop_codon:yes gene_type:complete